MATGKNFSYLKDNQEDPKDKTKIREDALKQVGASVGKYKCEYFSN